MLARPPIDIVSRVAKLCHAFGIRTIGAELLAIIKGRYANVTSFDRQVQPTFFVRQHRPFDVSSVGLPPLDRTDRAIDTAYVAKIDARKKANSKVGNFFQFVSEPPEAEIDPKVLLTPKHLRTREVLRLRRYSRAVNREWENDAKVRSVPYDELRHHVLERPFMFTAIESKWAKDWIADPPASNAEAPDDFTRKPDTHYHRLTHFYMM